jgi:dihydrofolate reductase
MRKVIYGMMVSLDGYIATPGWEIDWILIDEELHRYVNEQESAVDTYLSGRRMYERMARFWPTADTDPSAPDFIVEYSRIWKRMPLLVVPPAVADLRLAGEPMNRARRSR